MDKDKLLEKIKKCLALSQSANQHEAALALKQAQALMASAGIDESEIRLSEIKQHDINEKLAKNLSWWHWSLAHTTAQTFGCNYYQVYPYIRFIGLKNRAELSAYAFSVLLRQIKSARRNYLKNLCEKRPKHRQFLADQFCTGWVTGVSSVLKAFELSEEEKKVMVDHKNTYEKNLKVAQVREIKNVSYLVKKQGDMALITGVKEGKEAKLYRGMAGKKDYQLVNKEAF